MKTFSLKLFTLLVVLITIQSCQDEPIVNDQQESLSEEAKEPLSVQEINTIITNSLKKSIPSNLLKLH